MRHFYFAVAVLFFQLTARSQTVVVSGACITGSITLNSIGSVAGRPAYQNTGTVAGTSGVLVSMYWIGSTDNVWVLDFDGQPYFQNPCNFSAGPPHTSPFTCPWTAVSGTTCTGGTALSVSGAATLPVQYIAFTGKKNNGSIQLDWTTAVELNNKGFDVQRSKDGADWTTIGFVPAATNNSGEKAYRFVDANPLQGKNYYRLLQYDVDNRSTASAIVVVDFSANGFYTLQHPANGLYQLNIQSADAVELLLLDPSGRTLLHKTAGQGNNAVDIRNYASGVYLLQLKKGATVITEKLIKQ